MKADFPDGKASWRCGRVGIHCCTRPVGIGELCEDTLEARDIQGDAIAVVGGPQSPAGFVASACANYSAFRSYWITQ
jgi:hypothetical protein